MQLAGSGLVLLVALIHVYIFVLESVLWTKPLGRRVFRLSEEKAAMTAPLALNQGFYNGFLAAGLFWSLASGAELLPRATFFLLCVAVAGVVGAATVSRRILFVQTVPAVAALAAVWLAR